ncbi:hypothetical protein NC653_022929 [Populus alba x Populus x berolinensis]|uniref:Uncharacterized protein n=1 Tax=Populus alba x Populus x berolinensis TaxID=444605 RepID=A0AAD6QAB7_9ROSI|nr:hypothetical protein NC653_022929 [Populus alba x Populus x berolinensis]
MDSTKDKAAVTREGMDALLEFETRHNVVAFSDRGVVAYFGSENEHGWLIFKIYSGKIRVQVDGENSESLLPSFME